MATKSQNSQRPGGYNSPEARFPRTEGAGRGPGSEERPESRRLLGGSASDDALKLYLAEIERRAEGEVERRRELVASIRELLDELRRSRHEHCNTKDQDKDAILVATFVSELLVPRFRSPKDRAMLAKLRQALELPVSFRRQLCLNAIHDGGKWFRRVSSLGTRRVVASLSGLDEGFCDLNESVVAELLRSYRRESRGVRGAMGAERILAELVYEVDGALGIEVSPEADQRTEVENIRRKLAKMARKAGGQANKAPRPRTQPAASKTRRQVASRKGH